MQYRWTLVDSMVTVAIIGILIAIFVPTLEPNKHTSTHQSSTVNSPEYENSSLVRYENDEVVCYRANGYEGIACKWKDAFSCKLNH